MILLLNINIYTEFETGYDIDQVGYELAEAGMPLNF